ncbi:hypothetical protein QA648_36580 (plasmid) [Rhizobium sp. CB3171]|uniref:hypothetical protein n=1 Tax=Rhizobium sp. CB3171 TaxID=3039157 RepID=UPI0024B11D30|nr:hypothetical protein [Rhizobium sp. CB3171]WFU07447.1 hypothetical protein QA648_36580 [Rhizobium sp. CB3171]
MEVFSSNWMAFEAALARLPLDYGRRKQLSPPPIGGGVFEFLGIKFGKRIHPSMILMV